METARAPSQRSRRAVKRLEDEDDIHRSDLIQKKTKKTSKCASMVTSTTTSRKPRVSEKAPPIRSKPSNAVPGEGNCVPLGCRHLLIVVEDIPIILDTDTADEDVVQPQILTTSPSRSPSPAPIPLVVMQIFVRRGKKPLLPFKQQIIDPNLPYDDIRQIIINCVIVKSKLRKHDFNESTDITIGGTVISSTRGGKMLPEPEYGSFEDDGDFEAVQSIIRDMATPKKSLILSILAVYTLREVAVRPEDQEGDEEASDAPVVPKRKVSRIFNISHSSALQVNSTNDYC